MYKKLAIVGNGFDLAHGLQTDYKSFYDSLPEHLSVKWKALLDEYKLNKEYWYQFEEAIHLITMDWFSEYFDAISNNKNINQIVEKSNYYNNVFNDMNKELIIYLHKESKKNINEILSVKKIVDSRTAAISFNYTDTTDLYFNHCYKIHGSIKEGFIVFGYKERAEPSGGAKESTRYCKNKLREILSYRRYLSSRGISKKKIEKEIRIFHKHVDSMFSGKGGYDIVNMPSHNVFDYRNQNIYTKFGAIDFLETENVKDKQEIIEGRSKEISVLLNDYGKNHGFIPSKINPGVNFNTVGELIILGHSLHADTEIIRDILIETNNLQQIILFTHKLESELELEYKRSILKELSNCPIKIVGI